LDIKAIDLWTAIQKRDDWLTECFTWVCFQMWCSFVVIIIIIIIIWKRKKKWVNKRRE